MVMRKPLAVANECNNVSVISFELLGIESAPGRHIR